MAGKREDMIASSLNEMMGAKKPTARSTNKKTSHVEKAIESEAVVDGVNLGSLPENKGKMIQIAIYLPEDWVDELKDRAYAKKLKKINAQSEIIEILKKELNR
ncbi:MAG: hypothetical protein FWF45_00570 [Coriobacteriia bacterium]|nr:hypothetical protein [Coriobacteriia bacterium]